MSPEEERGGGEKNAIYSGHLRLCQQPRAAHALRSDQKCITIGTIEDYICQCILHEKVHTQMVE